MQFLTSAPNLGVGLASYPTDPAGLPKPLDLPSVTMQHVHYWKSIFLCYKPQI